MSGWADFTQFTELNPETSANDDLGDARLNGIGTSRNMAVFTAHSAKKHKPCRF